MDVLILCYLFFLDERHKKLRYNLKVAIKSRDRYQLDYNITEFKKEKLEDTDMDLAKAEKILKELIVRDGLCPETFNFILYTVQRFLSP